MSTNDIRAQLEEERQLIDAATDIEWYVNNSTEESTFVCCTYPSSPPDQHLIAEVPNMYQSREGNADAAFITHARTALPVRNAQVEAVLALHKPDEIRDRSAGMTRHECRADLDPWPCPTVRAIEEAGK